MLMALFMRLLVPDGYMLEAGGQGLGIVLCGGGGPELVAGAHAVHSARHHGDQGSGPDGGQHSVCPYAALGAPSSPPPPIALAAPAAFPALAPAALAASQPVGPRLAAPPPPARGPPAA